MPKMSSSKKSNFAGKAGSPGVMKGAKIRTPFEYPMADKGPAKKGASKRSSSKGGSKRY